MRLHERNRGRHIAVGWAAFQLLLATPAVHAADAGCEIPAPINQYPVPAAMLAASDARRWGEAYRIGSGSLARCNASARSDECIDLLFEMVGAADFAGMHAEAEATGREIVELSARVYGRESLQFALAASNLGTSLAQQSRFNDARDYYHAALDIRRRRCGERDLATARSYRNLAGVQRSLGYISDSVRNADTSLKIELAVAGDRAGSTADAYRAMALSVAEQGDVAKALALTEKALSIQLRLEPRDIMGVSASYNDIGVYKTYLGRKAESLASHEKAYALLGEVLDEDHPEMMTKAGNLAAILMSLDRYVRAEALVDQVIAAHKRHPGVALESVGTAFSVKAALLRKAGRPAEALSIYRYLVNLYAGTHGEESPRLLLYRTSLAAVAIETGEASESLRQFRILVAEANNDLQWAARRGSPAETVIDYRDVFAGAVKASWAVSNGSR